MPSILEQHVRKALKKVLQEDFNYDASEQELLLRPTPKEFSGQLSCILFPLAKKIAHPLPQLGKTIGEALLAEQALVAGYELVQGFLNLQLQDAAWIKAAAQLRDHLSAAPPQRRILIEYSSPNTNKPLHLGHMRNNFLGDSLARILEALGHKTYRVNLVNDRGIHICKSMVAYLRDGGTKQPSHSCKGDHWVGSYYVRFEQLFQQEIAELQQQGLSPTAAAAASPIMQEAQQMLLAWEQEDKEVRRCWKQLNNWVYEGFDATYTRLGICFDHTYYESDTYLLGKDLVEEGLQRGLFYRKSDEAVAVDLEKEGLGEKILLRADGTSVYITQDLGTAELKYKDYPFDTSLYVVGDEQNYHFKVLFAVLKCLGRGYASDLRHISYGMVDLPSGKMKSREGTVVDADTLLDELEQMAAEKTKLLGKTEALSEIEQKQLHQALALGAIKYFLLKVQPSKRILFDPDASLDVHAVTGTFVQYTHARISALLRRAQTEGIAPAAGLFPEQLTAEEQALIAELLRYGEQVQAAAAAYDPSILAQYLYELARRYNRWYETHPIFKSAEASLRPWRLWLCARSQWRLEHGLSLLGIHAPIRM